MTPEESQKCINAGLGDRLMRDYLEPSEQLSNSERIYILAPASVGYEGKDARELDLASMLDSIFRVNSWSKGRCNFLTGELLCEIHQSGFKPIQCVGSFGCEKFRKENYLDNFAVAKLWNTEEGRKVVSDWAQKYFKGEKK